MRPVIETFKAECKDTKAVINFITNIIAIDGENDWVSKDFVMNTLFLCQSDNFHFYDYHALKNLSDGLIIEQLKDSEGYVIVFDCAEIMPKKLRYFILHDDRNSYILLFNNSKDDMLKWESVYKMMFVYAPTLDSYITVDYHKIFTSTEIIDKKDFIGRRVTRDLLKDSFADIWVVLSEFDTEVVQLQDGTSRAIFNSGIVAAMYNNESDILCENCMAVKVDKEGRLSQLNKFII